MQHTVLAPGHLCLIPQMVERRGDCFPVIPLDFNDTVCARPPPPTRLFEVFRQGFVVVRGQAEVFDECHHLTATAFRSALYDGTVLGGSEGSTARARWPRFA